MSIEAVVRTISLILAPVVMVSSCALILGGLLPRYEALGARLRALERERLDLARAGASRDPATDHLARLDTQVPRLLRRHRLLRDAILAVYLAIVIFVASMFVIALAAATSSTPIASTALLVFLAGTSAMLAGAVLTILEVHRSHRDATDEVLPAPAR